MRRIDPVRRRTILVILLVVAAIVVLLLPSGGSARAARGKTNEERVAFLTSLGWDVESVPVKEQVILLPKLFPEVLLKYNELQKEQDFDLEKYAGKTVTMYCYKVSGGEEGAEKLCTLYVYKNRIIGGDVHTVSFEGEMEKLR